VTEKLDFVVARADLHGSRFISSKLERLRPGELLLKVDSFAFTTNNITYAELGETLHYWDFYPAPEGWGSIPVWGFADVIDSRHEAIKPDERLWGYWPMATHAVLRPERVSDGALVDGTEHRKKLPAAYNNYLRTAGDPAYQERHEDLQSLLRPLFVTSFLIDDFLAEEKFFGAQAVVISSASSKTAFSLAHRLHRRGGIEVVGLTSFPNRGFVKSLGCCDRVLEYEKVHELENKATVFVDIAGSGNVRKAVHEHLRDNLKYSCAVGLSHRDKHPPGSGLPGAKPVFFFAPEQGRKRQQDWGREGYNARFAEAWRAFLPFAEKSLKVFRSAGESAINRIYMETLEGRVAPDCGNILSLRDARS
jgi:hypothetical protein